MTTSPHVFIHDSQTISSNENTFLQEADILEILGNIEDMFPR